MVDPTQILLTILGVLMPMLASLVSLAYWIGGKFSSIDEKFNSINGRFNSIDEKFKDIDRRFDELKNYVDTKFNELKDYVDNRLSRLIESSKAYQEFFIEYLAFRGLLKPMEASMLKNELARILSQC